MKKQILWLLFATLLLPLVYSCSNDDEPSTSLKGTKWTSTYTSNVLVLDFTSGNNVEFYGADNNLNQSGETHYGTYSISGDRVTFNLEGGFYEKMKFKSAIIKGSSMEVTYEHNGGIIDKWETSTRTFRKR